MREPTSARLSLQAMRLSYFKNHCVSMLCVRCAISLIFVCNNVCACVYESNEACI